MNHYTNDHFWRSYDALPAEVRSLADKSFALLKSDPHHPSLHFKKVGRFWSARVSRRYRAVATEDGDDLLWFWIGAHDEYERLIDS